MPSLRLEALRRAANAQTIFAFLVIVVAVNAVVFPLVAQRMAEAAGGSVRPLDLRLSYSQEQAYTTLLALGDHGRRLYGFVESTIDMVYPIFYALFFFLLIERLLLGITKPRWLDLATLLPFAAMFFDWLENAAILAMIARFPRPPGTVATLGSVSTTMKWIAFPLTLALVLYAAVRRFVMRRAADPTSP